MNIINMHDIGMKISTLRKERDMTQLELADKMGVSYQAVSSWERGATMPDISRLPDISQVLGVSIDELFGNSTQAEMVKNVLNRQTDAYTQDNKPNINDIAEIAPILKPSQVDNLVEKADTATLSLSALTSLAPFLSQELLGQFALKAEDMGDIDVLHKLAPFLGKEPLDQLARRLENAGGLGAIKKIAPFMSQETLDEMALMAYGNGDMKSLHKVAPFLGKDIIRTLAMQIEESEGIGALSGLAPFVDEETLGQLAIKSIEAGDNKGLRSVAPHLDGETLRQLLLRAGVGDE